jgi:hypothetical protein
MHPNLLLDLRQLLPHVAGAGAGSGACCSGTAAAGSSACTAEGSRTVGLLGRGTPLLGNAPCVNGGSGGRDVCMHNFFVM